MIGQITHFRKDFLPVKFDPLGQYPNSKSVQSHTRAFILLCHAEIETFLEEWAKDIARSCENLWLSKAKVSTPLVYLVATYAKPVNAPSSIQTSSPKDITTLFADEAKMMFQRYYKSIADNNGIKELNYLALMSPLGAPTSVLPSTLLPNLDYLGSIRGKHAHHSSKAVASILDPEVEYKRILALLNELQVLDQILQDYKRKVR